MNELIILEDVIPEHWVLSESSRTWNTEGPYDEKIAYDIDILDQDSTIARGWFVLYRADTLTYYNYYSYERYVAYQPDYPPPLPMVLNIEYADEWKIGCEYYVHLDQEGCDIIAAYQEFLFHLMLRTAETVRYGNVSMIVEEIVAVIEAQDQHIGTMLRITP